MKPAAVMSVTGFDWSRTGHHETIRTPRDRRRSGGCALR
jgi:hypothetical protein